MVPDPAQSEGNYQPFIDRVRETGEVWGLQLDEEWAYCESNEYEETEVLLFWSSRAAAQKHVQEDWSDHKPERVALEDFLNKWLPGMDEDGALVGPDWDVDLVGPEVEPRELAEKLEAEAEE